MREIIPALRFLRVDRPLALEAIHIICDELLDGC